MSRLVRFSLALALGLVALVPRASAEWPAVIAHGDRTEIRGLPAISGDGRTIAFASIPETRGDDERIAIDFVDVRTGRSTGEWLVLERDELGHLMPMPDDARGHTPWRRARNLTLHFAARGYRELVTLSSPDDWDPWAHDDVILDGGGLHLVQTAPADDVVLVDAAGRERYRAHLPLMSSFCGMSDEAPSMQPPSVMSAVVDPHTRTLVLSYGHTYASCMCDDSVARRVAHYAR